MSNQGEFNIYFFKSLHLIEGGNEEKILINSVLLCNNLVNRKTPKTSINLYKIGQGLSGIHTCGEKLHRKPC